jgi:hypothetical protein
VLVVVGDGRPAIYLQFVIVGYLPAVRGPGIDAVDQLAGWSLDLSKDGGVPDQD